MIFGISVTTVPKPSGQDISGA